MSRTTCYDGYAIRDLQENVTDPSHIPLTIGGCLDLTLDPNVEKGSYVHRYCTFPYLYETHPVVDDTAYRLSFTLSKKKLVI